MSYYNGIAFFSGCFMIALACILFSALGGWIFMLLWNWLAPLFWESAPVLSFWQAWGVTFVISWIANMFRYRKSS